MIAEPASRPLAGWPLIGRSPPMLAIERGLARLATADLAVLISGEPGTGKSFVARALHDHGCRRDFPFVTVALAELPPARHESILFGDRQPVTGRYHAAAAGTLFLDGVECLPAAAQLRLLRLLDAADGPFPRIIAATADDLRARARAGTFREELFHRLNLVPIRLPALRDRADDIALLARHFLAQTGQPGRSFDDAALAALRALSWPGNVRELRDFVVRLAARAGPGELGADSVAAELAAARLPPAPEGAAEPLSRAVERHIRQFLAAHQDCALPGDIHARVLAEVERPLIQITLAMTRGNQIKAAAMLGLNRNTLRKKIRELDIAVVKGLA